MAAPVTYLVCLDRPLGGPVHFAQHYIGRPWTWTGAWRRTGPARAHACSRPRSSAGSASRSSGPGRAAARWSAVSRRTTGPGRSARPTGVPCEPGPGSARDRDPDRGRGRVRGRPHLLLLTLTKKAPEIAGSGAFFMPRGEGRPGSCSFPRPDLVLARPLPEPDRQGGQHHGQGDEDDAVRLMATATTIAIRLVTRQMPRTGATSLSLGFPSFLSNSDSSGRGADSRILTQNAAVTLHHTSAVFTVSAPDTR